MLAALCYSFVLIYFYVMALVRQVCLPTCPFFKKEDYYSDSLCFSQGPTKLFLMPKPKQQLKTKLKSEWRLNPGIKETPSAKYTHTSLSLQTYNLCYHQLSMGSSWKKNSWWSILDKSTDAKRKCFCSAIRQNRVMWHRRMRTYWNIRCFWGCCNLLSACWVFVWRGEHVVLVSH